MNFIELQPIACGIALKTVVRSHRELLPVSAFSYKNESWPRPLDVLPLD